MHGVLGLSYTSCEYIYVNADLDESEESIYNSAARFWLDMREAYVEALQLTGGSPAAWKIYWSTHQRFFQALCSSAKIKTVVSETERGIKEGYCVVIGLRQATAKHSTGAARTVGWVSADLGALVVCVRREHGRILDGASAGTRGG